MRLEGLEGRTAVVTGASGGIGRRVCEVLLDQGARVAGADLAAPDLPGVFGVAADVTDPASVDAAFAQVEAEIGLVDVLVLNAGVFIVRPFAETTMEQWNLQVDVNLTGPFICARRAVPGMAERGWGRVVAVGSSAGVTGGASSCAGYAASKAGVMTLAKSIANEFAGTGVLANAVAPALIDTPMLSEQPPGMEEKVPIGRLGTPDDVAGLIAFLCSDHGSFITGEVVDINGGFLVD